MSFIDIIRTIGKSVMPFIMMILFLFLLVCIYRSRKEIKAHMPHLNRLQAIVLVIFILGTALFRIFVVPGMYYTLYDNLETMQAAQNIVHSGLYGVCKQGSVTNCEVITLANWPPAQSFLFAQSIFLFGDTDAVKFATGAVFSSAAILLLFILIFLYTGNIPAGLITSILFSGFIPGITRSKTADLANTYIFFFLASLILIELVLRTRMQKRSLILAAIASIAMLINIRDEGIIWIILLGCYTFIRIKATPALQHMERRKGIKERIEMFNWRHILLFLLFIMPYILLEITVSDDEIYQMDLAYRIDNLQTNLPQNVAFFFSRQQGIIIPTIAALLAIVMLPFTKLKKYRSIIVPLVLIFLSLFFIYSQHNETQFSRPHRMRYTIILSVVLSLIASCFISWLFQKVRTRWKIVALSTGLMCLFFLLHAPGLYSISSVERFEVLNSYYFVEDIKPELQMLLQNNPATTSENSSMQAPYIITASPRLILNLLSESDARVITADGFIDLIKQQKAPENAYILKEWIWEYRNETYAKKESIISSAYDEEVLATKTYESYPYSFIKLTKKTLASNASITASDGS